MDTLQMTIKIIDTFNLQPAMYVSLSKVIKFGDKDAYIDSRTEVEEHSHF